MWEIRWHSGLHDVHFTTMWCCDSGSKPTSTSSFFSSSYASYFSRFAPNRGPFQYFLLFITINIQYEWCKRTVVLCCYHRRRHVCSLHTPYVLLSGSTHSLPNHCHCLSFTKGVLCLLAYYGVSRNIWRRRRRFETLCLPKLQNVKIFSHSRKILKRKLLIFGSRLNLFHL